MNLTSDNIKPILMDVESVMLELWTRATWGKRGVLTLEFRLDSAPYAEYHLHIGVWVPIDHDLVYRSFPVRPTGNKGHGVYLVPAGTPVAKKPEPLTRGSAEEYLADLEVRIKDLERAPRGADIAECLVKLEERIDAHEVWHKDSARRISRIETRV